MISITRWDALHKSVLQQQENLVSGAFACTWHLFLEQVLNVAIPRLY